MPDHDADPKRELQGECCAPGCTSGHQEQQQSLVGSCTVSLPNGNACWNLGLGDRVRIGMSKRGRRGA